MRHALLALLLLTSAAHADDLTVGLGGARDYSSFTNYKVLTVDWRTSPHVMLTSGFIHGHNPKGAPDFSTKWVGASLIEDEKYLYDGFGIIRLSRQTHNLTSLYQFYLIFGGHVGNWNLSYRHISNGGTYGANYGEDMVIFGYTFGN